MSLYYDKYLKYKNKYVNLKNQIGGALKESGSAKESSRFTDVTTFLEELIREVHISRQKITMPDDSSALRHIPPSDILLQSIFNISSNEQLENLYEYLNFIYLSIQAKMKNKHVDYIKYNSILSRIHNLIIKNNNNNSKITKDYKCLLLSIKFLPKSKSKDFELNKFDEDKFRECNSIISTPIVHNSSSSAAGGGSSNSNSKTLIDWENNEFDSSEKHFNIKAEDGHICSFKYDDIDSFYTIILMATDQSPELIITESLIPNEISENGDLISYGSIMVDNHIFKLKMKLHHATGPCEIYSDSRAILDYMSKNNQFVEKKIKENPLILSSDKYKYNFEERRNIISFNVYKKINKKIYRLLFSNRDSVGYSSIKCKICDIYTTGTTNPIICSKCKKAYCRLCEDLDHSPNKCRSEVVSHKDDEEASAAFVETSTTICPICSSKLFRQDGCAHLTCQQCKSNGRDTHVCDFCGVEIFGANRIELYAHFNNNTCSKLNFERDGDATHFTKRKIILRNKHGKFDGDRIYEAEVLKQKSEIELEEARFDKIDKYRLELKAKELADAQESINSSALKTAHPVTGRIPLNYLPKSDKKKLERIMNQETVKEEQQINKQEKAFEKQKKSSKKRREAYEKREEDEYNSSYVEEFYRIELEKENRIAREEDERIARERGYDSD